MSDIGVVLDENVLHKMKLRITELETVSVINDKKNDKKLVDEIIRIIEEEAECSLRK